MYLQFLDSLLHFWCDVRNSFWEDTGNSLHELKVVCFFLGEHFLRWNGDFETACIQNVLKNACYVKESCSEEALK